MNNVNTVGSRVEKMREWTSNVRRTSATTAALIAWALWTQWCVTSSYDPNAPFMCWGFAIENGFCNRAEIWKMVHPNGGNAWAPDLESVSGAVAQSTTLAVPQWVENVPQAQVVSQETSVAHVPNWWWVAYYQNLLINEYAKIMDGEATIRQQQAQDINAWAVIAVQESTEALAQCKQERIEELWNSLTASLLDTTIANCNAEYSLPNNQRMQEVVNKANAQWNKVRWATRWEGTWDNVLESIWNWVKN